MDGTMSAKKALKNLWNPKAKAKEKGKAVQDRPGVARVTEVIRALIPLIILGLVLLILHFAAPSAFNWVISYGSLGAKLTGSLIPAAIALLTIGIGVGNRVKHNQYLHNLNEKKSKNSKYKSKQDLMFPVDDLMEKKIDQKELESKINKDKDESNQNKIEIQLANYLKFYVATTPVNKSLLSEINESASERTLDVGFVFDDNSIATVKVKIPLSDKTPFSKVKYLIAEYLKVIQGTGENQLMPVMNIFVMQESDRILKHDDDKIGGITHIVVTTSKDSEKKEGEEKLAVERHLELVAQKVIVQNVPLTTDEMALERELTIDFYCNNAWVETVKVKIKLSNKTLISEVKYLIAKYFKVIKETKEGATRPKMKIGLDKKNYVERLNGDRAIGVITHIRVDTKSNDYID